MMKREAERTCKGKKMEKDREGIKEKLGKEM